MKRRKDIQDIAEEFNDGVVNVVRIIAFVLGISFFLALIMTGKPNPRFVEFFSTCWDWIWYFLSTCWDWIWYFLGWVLYLILGAVLVCLLVFLVLVPGGLVKDWVGARRRASINSMLARLDDDASKFKQMRKGLHPMDKRYLAFTRELNEVSHEMAKLRYKVRQLDNKCR